MTRYFSIDFHDDEIREGVTRLISGFNDDLAAGIVVEHDRVLLRKDIVDRLAQLPPEVPGHVGKTRDGGRTVILNRPESPLLVQLHDPSSDWTVQAWDTALTIGQAVEAVGGGVTGIVVDGNTSSGDFPIDVYAAGIDHMAGLRALAAAGSIEQWTTGLKIHGMTRSGGVRLHLLERTADEMLAQPVQQRGFIGTLNCAGVRVTRHEWWSGPSGVSGDLGMPVRVLVVGTADGDLPEDEIRYGLEVVSGLSVQAGYEPMTNGRIFSGTWVGDGFSVEVLVGCLGQVVVGPDQR